MPSTHIERYIRSIFVQNIPAGITEDLFRQMLSQFGVLIHFHMFLDPSGANNTNEQNLQTSRGYAFAEVRAQHTLRNNSSLFTFVFLVCIE
jgi:RNA recognition motif-containing protein